MQRNINTLHEDVRKYEYFWKEVKNIIETIISKQNTTDPKLFLLVWAVGSPVIVHE